jgi:alpha(1,3/1,4) fucosyltransferase
VRHLLRTPESNDRAGHTATSLVTEAAAPSSRNRGAARSEVALFIDPPNRGHGGDRLFAPGNGPDARDDVNAPWVHLRRRLGSSGVRVHTVDLLESGAVEPARQNLYVSFGPRHRRQRLVSRFGLVRSGFFALECPIVDPRLYLDLSTLSDSFKTVYSFSTEASLRPFLRAPVRLEQFHLPNAHDRVHDDQWRNGERRFLTMINANKLPQLTLHELYTERLRAVEYFNGHGEIDLYGIGWEGPAYRVTTTRTPGRVRAVAHHARSRWERMRPPSDPLRVAARAAWRGPVASKADVLSRYTYAICFENMVLEGWITEKIFDCFFSGTIPVYLGAPDVVRWIPPECFVDMRRFNGYAELREYLKHLGPDQIDGYRQAARDYLRSDAFSPFTKEAFAERLAGIVSRDSGVEA